MGWPSMSVRRLETLALHVSERPNTSPIAAATGSSPADLVQTYKQVDDGDDLSLHIFYPPSHQATDARPAMVRS